MPEPILLESPLTAVVCEVRFEGSDLKPNQLVELAEQFAQTGLTEYSTDEGFQLSVAPGDVQQTRVSRHRFSQADGSAAITVDTNAFALVTSGYQGIDLFLKVWAPLASAVVKTLELATRTRIGLRYTNELKPNGDSKEAVATSVNEALLAPWGAQERLGALTVCLQELRFRQELGELTFRHGLQRIGASAPPVYLLDFDHYESRLRALDIEAECDRLRRFNKVVYDIFRWSITDEQYEAFKPQERDV